MKVFCFDGSSKVQDLDRHTLLGQVRCTLSGVMCAPGQVLSLDLTGGKEEGRLEVRGEATHHTRDNLVVTFAANKLTNKEGFFGTSSPFLKISRYAVDLSRTSCLCLVAEACLRDLQMQ